MADSALSSVAKPERISLDQLTADIPAMPMVASQAMHMLGNPDAKIAEIADMISSDPAMASRLLRIANSPVFGSLRKISSINDALVRVGFSAAKGLIITVSIRGIYKMTGLLEQLLWEHAVGCAIASSLISRQLRGAVNSSEAYTGGLLHDVGQMLLSNARRAVYEPIFQEMYNKKLPRLSLLEMERERFEVAHPEVGERAIAKWNLAPALGECARWHHASHPDQLKALTSPKLVATVHVANVICMHLGIGLRYEDTTVPLYDSPYLEYLGLSGKDVADLVEKTIDAFEAEKETFSL